MKSVFHILYIRPNSATNEQIAIGLILSDGRNVSYLYSEEKLHLLYQIYPGIRLIDQTLNQIGSFLNELSSSNSPRDINALLDYTIYLSKYNDGILQFSEQYFISKDTNKEVFKNLFDRLILFGTELRIVSI